jgi:hypothetical protein
MSAFPHVAWHERAGLDKAALAANLEAIRAEGYGTPTDKARAIWEHAFTSAARAGFDSARVLLAQTTGDTPRAYSLDPRDLAATELATAPRRAADTYTGPHTPPPLRQDHEALAELADGRISFVSDSHSTALGYSDPFAAPSIGDYTDAPDPAAAARAAEIAEADHLFFNDARAETGGGTSPEVYERQQRNRSTLRTQSNRMVELLALGGIIATRADTACLYTYWIHSKQFEKIPSFRRICLIPEVASMVRAPKLAALEFWLQSHPYARFWTFTTGERCPLEDLEDRLTWLNRQIGKVNKAIRPLGAEIVFRSTEFGTLETEHLAADKEETMGGLEFAADGSPRFHPHAHCVVIAHFGYNPQKWNAVFAIVNDLWKKNGQRIHWDKGSRIRNARECVKYVSKPGDLLKLTPATLAHLFEITYRAKLCQPLGTLAAEIRARRDKGLCLRRVRGANRKMEWVERLNHNRASRETDEEKAAMENIQDAIDMAGEYEQALNVDQPSHPGALDGGLVAARDNRAPGACRVMARIMPAAGPTPLKEPRVIVLCPEGRFDLRAVQGHPLVFSLWSETVQAWEQARVGIRAVSVSVTPTVSTPAHQRYHDLAAEALLSEPSHPPDPIFRPARAFAPSATA